MNSYKLKPVLHRTAKISWSILRFFILFGLGYTLLQPFLILITGAFRAEQDLWDPSVVWITRNFTLENITAVMEVMKYGSTLKTTALIAIGSALLQTFSCAFAGYGFARYDFKGKGVFFAIVILTIMVPPQVLMLPTYSTYRQLGLLDSVFSFWISALFGMGLRSGLYIFIYRQVFRAMPTELEEAANIDGCGNMGIFFRIMLPNASNSMVMVFLFSLIWNSTDYFTTSVLMPTKQTLTTALTSLNSQLSSLISGGSQSTVSPLLLQARMQAGSLLTVLPLILIFVFCQRFFRSGIERSGLVG